MSGGRVVVERGLFAVRSGSVEWEKGWDLIFVCSLIQLMSQKREEGKNHQI